MVAGVPSADAADGGAVGGPIEEGRVNRSRAQGETEERDCEEFTFHIAELFEVNYIPRTSRCGIPVNWIARCPELTLRWRFVRKIGVWLTVLIMPRKRGVVNIVFQVFSGAETRP